MSDERTPRPAPGNPSELQQLEAALAAGHLTPELFATLKAQLQVAAPTPLPAPAANPAPPISPPEELPSLLDMFTQPPRPASPPAQPASPSAARPAPPASVAAAPASPPPVAAADVAARQLIEERLTQIRQRPAAASAPPAPVPVPTPAPAPAPGFYPAPPAPTFYPAAPVAEVASPPPAPARAAAPPRPAPARASAPPAEPAAGGLGRWVWGLLLALAVVGGLAYFFTQNSHPDENLTSPSLPKAEPEPTEVATPKPAKKAKKSTKKKRKSKVPAPVATASEAEAAPEPEAAASQPVAVAVAAAASAPTRAAPAASQPIAAAPEAGDDAATTKVRAAMAAYYTDLHAPPLHASQHFAPQVERLYIQQNLTPAAIDAELTRSFFPDNQQAVAQIEPGTLRVSAPAADGSRTATFTENMRLYRVSKQQFQQLRTQVRVRFNADYQIAYMRQEKLLANTFE